MSDYTIPPRHCGGRKYYMNIDEMKREADDWNEDEFVHWSDYNSACHLCVELAETVERLYEDRAQVMPEVEELLKRFKIKSTDTTK